MPAQLSSVQKCNVFVSPRLHQEAEGCPGGVPRGRRPLEVQPRTGTAHFPPACSAVPMQEMLQGAPRPSAGSPSPSHPPSTAGTLAESVLGHLLGRQRQGGGLLSPTSYIHFPRSKLFCCCQCKDPAGPPPCHACQGKARVIFFSRGAFRESLACQHDGAFSEGL